MKHNVLYFSHQARFCLRQFIIRKGATKLKQYNAQNIINIALLGHGSSGKTTLADAILYSAGQIDRMGKVEDGTATLDFDAEERKRKVSVSTAVYQFEAGEKKINLIDAPGLFDFAGGVSEALTAADSVLVVLSGKSGLAVGARQSVEKAKKLQKGCSFFIGKLNSTHASFAKVYASLQEKYGSVLCPVVVPHMEGEAVGCYVNLLNGKAYKYDGFKATECECPADKAVETYRAQMIETVAGTDEALMEKFFEGETLSEAELIEGIRKATAAGDVYPVYAGAGATGEAVDLLIDIMGKIAPTADMGKFKLRDGEGVAAADIDPNGQPAVLVFKTIADPFVGKLSYFKVLSGTVKADTKFINARTGNEERLAKIMFLKGGKQEDTAIASAGDIASVAKLGDVITGDTLAASGFDKIAVGEAAPSIRLSMAVYPKNKGDEDKIASGITRLVEEDPSIRFEINTETKEQVVSGLGEQHLDVVASKLKSKFGVEVVLQVPRVAYRETIRKKVKVQGRHKKQSGGHGQFGDVWIEFEPCDSTELVFEEKVFGGAVPKNFFPAVEKGLKECTARGVLAGYPMVGLKATLVDGSYHPVDSSEMSFKMAAALAYKAGIPQASPVLLEPIGTLTVSIPDETMGDVIGDINKRRGRVLGMNPEAGGRQEIVAEVPMGEMGDFSTAMRSITQGRSVFNLKFERYEEAPSHIREKVIAESGYKAED